MKIFKRVKQAVVNALRQGWSPQAVCWSVAWGFTWSIFPIYGITMATLGVIGMIWKLNHPIMQSINYLMAPVKFLLIIPYIRLGEWMFRPERPFTLSIPEFTLRFKDAPLDTLAEFAATFLHAIIGWLVTVPLLMAGSYLVTSLTLRTGQAARDAISEARS
jgi:uncharacterized protein (DUF2062 family)